MNPYVFYTLGFCRIFERQLKLILIEGDKCRSKPTKVGDTLMRILSKGSCLNWLVDARNVGCGPNNQGHQCIHQNTKDNGGTGIKSDRGLN